MTTIADLHGTRPDDAAGTELIGYDDAAARIGGDCLKDGPVGQVGLEIEAHCFDLTDPLRRPSWDELTAVIAQVPPLPSGSPITVEPGGAVELSGLPAGSVLPAIAAMQADRAVLSEAFAGHGLGLVLLGADPLRPPERVNPGDRYRAMERFFEASGTTDAGAAMMTSTASVQVNLDAGPRDGWADRVRLAHALGPTMIAIAANSPLLGTEFSGWRSTRQRVWSRLDSARVGPVLGASGGDPAGDWVRYALKAPVMLVLGPEVVPMTEVVPFADWADGRALLGGRRPTVADLEYHLTTLFPPVRPRGWLELRMIDALPEEWWPVAVAVATALLDDPDASARAVRATAGVRNEWQAASRDALGHPGLHAAALECFDAARDALSRLPADPATVAAAARYSERYVERGRCPADDQLDEWSQLRTARV
ncbi:MAG: glutamate--cysteine ligase [Mycobacterium sp.]|nr:glutamate--cysteine ligase [Mycobacterium sp.]